MDSPISQLPPIGQVNPTDVLPMVQGGVTGKVTAWQLQSGPARTVNVKDPQFAGGAKGDGVTDDTAAIQAAINFARSISSLRAGGVIDPTSPYFVTSSALIFPPGRYIVTKSLWFGIDSGIVGWDASKIVECVSGYGAVIVGHTAGKPVIDMAGAFGMRIRGLTVFANTTSEPNVGILLARSGNAAGDNPSGGAHRFVDVNVHGDFSIACVYNYASEINVWQSCYLYQNSGIAAYYGTNNNARQAITSQNCTIATTVQSAYGDFFDGCIIKSSTGNVTANGAVMYLESLDFGPSVMNSYIDSSGSVYMPNFWFRNAQGLTSANTTSFNQSCRIIGNTFEYRSTLDTILIDADHTVIDLTVEGNSMPVNAAGGKLHINVANTGKLKNLRVQHTDGGTLGDPVLIGGAGEVYGQESGVFFMRSALVGAGWQYVEGDLTKDGTFHSLDLTTLGVPTTAKFVAVRVLAKTTAAADANSFQLRASGVANAAQYFEVTPPVSNIAVQHEGLVPVVGGKIDYSVPANFVLARILLREYHL